MIFFIIAFGLILRLVSLNQSLWLDEATSALVSKMPTQEIFSKFLPGDFHPPLYYLILKYWVGLFGSSEISVRFPSVVFGVATIYIVYLIGKELVNKNTGLMAAGLAATSGLLIYYSQEARMYSLAAFLVTALIFSLVKTIKRGRVGDWIFFSILLGLTAVTDYVAALIIPAIWIYAAISKQNFSWWKKFIMSHIILAGFLISWFPVFTLQLHNGLTSGVTSPLWFQILGQTTIKNLALIPVKFMIGRIAFDNEALYGLIMALSAFLFGFLFMKASKSNLLIWTWLIAPILFGAVIGFKIPALYYFRFLFCLPAFYLLAATGLDKLGKHKNLVLITVLGFNLLTSGYYLFSSRFQREDWRAAARALGSDKIIFPGNSQKEALIYYGKANQIVGVDGIKKNDREIWLSRYVREIFDPSDSTRLKIEALGYNKASEVDFNGVIFWKYNKN